MPVYMRKRQGSLSLSQFSEPSPDIDADFVLDPDKHREPLPQPYRFIDKILETLLERTFQEMFSREEEREEEQNRYKPPVVPTDLCRVVPNVRSARFLCASADTNQQQQLGGSGSGGGCCVFVAAEGQLLALDAVTMATLGAFDAPGLDLAHLATAQLRPGLHLLAALDDLGLARLFLWDAQAAAFHLARLLNDEADSGGERRLNNCLAVHLSADGEYLGLALQNASTQAVTLEFHRIPRDAWSKEVEQQTGGKPPATVAAPAEEVDGGGGGGGSEQPADEAGGTAADEAARIPALKLTPVALVLRVKQPPTVAASAAATTPSFKAVDATGEVIGSGQAHLLTQGHLQLREENFRRRRCAAEMRLLESDESAAAGEGGNITLPSVLFLKPGRTLGTDQTSDKDQFVSAAVSWSGDYKVMIYSLLKVGKDLEFRPDAVWTCGSPVTCLAASPCCSLVAVGLESGSLLVHDARLGLTRHVISVEPGRPIARVFFVNPAVSAAATAAEAAATGASPAASTGVYRSVQPVQAAVFTADFSAHLVDLGPEAIPAARSIASSGGGSGGRPRHAYEATQLVDYPRCHPSLLVRVTRSGGVVLHDLRLAREVLQFCLPPPHQLPCPWQPGGWTLAAGGRSLFVRGRDDETGDERLFYYGLKMLIPMAPYWKLQAPEVPCYAHCRVEQRADAYLQHRNATHAERQKNLSDMWSNLFSTLKDVELAKAAADASETPRSVRTLHTSLSSFSDDSKDARLKEFLQRDSMPVA